MSELLGRYARDRWDADGEERDGGKHRDIADGGLFRTQLRIVPVNAGVQCDHIWRPDEQGVMTCMRCGERE